MISWVESFNSWLKAQVDELALEQVMQLQKQPVQSAERMVACS